MKYPPRRFTMAALIPRKPPHSLSTLLLVIALLLVMHVSDAAAQNPHSSPHGMVSYGGFRITAEQELALRRIGSGNETLDDALVAADVLIPEGPVRTYARASLEFEFSAKPEMPDVDIVWSSANDEGITVAARRGTLDVATETRLRRAAPLGVPLTIVEDDPGVNFTAVPGGDGLKETTSFPLNRVDVTATCTKGWTAKRTAFGITSWYLVTAGHCLDFLGQGLFRHAPLQGTPEGPSFLYGDASAGSSTPFPVAINNTYWTPSHTSFADAQALFVGSGATPPTAARQAGVQTPRGVEHALTSWDTNTFPIGSQLCFTTVRFSSGPIVLPFITEVCGKWIGFINRTASTEVVPDGSVRLLQQTSLLQLQIDLGSPNRACAGDSGAPVYGQYFGTQVSAMGMVSGGNGPVDSNGCGGRYLYAVGMPAVLGQLNMALVK
jgi:hypothetical protein